MQHTWRALQKNWEMCGDVASVIELIQRGDEMREALLKTLEALRAARRGYSKILAFNLVRDEAKREAIVELLKTLDAAIATAKATA